MYPTEGTPIDRLSRLTSARLLLLTWIFAPLGCMSSAWQHALVTDTPLAYHQFIRMHPDSKHADGARERIVFHDVKRRPSLSGYELFRQSYPRSPLLDQLRPLIEELAFEASRSVGSEESYRAFAAEFQGSALARRAEGNSIYLEARGFSGQAGELRRFALQHPDSDFAAEAMRSVQALAVRQGTGFERVGLVIDISPGTPEADRLVKVFRSRALEHYQKAGIELVIGQGKPPADGPRVRLFIQHREEIEAPQLSAESLGRAGVVARTVVSLRDEMDDQPVFERVFELRIDPREHIDGASILFASEPAKRYWSQFFVPVASWHSTAAVRSVLELEKRVVAVDAVLGRAVALFSDGDFQLIGLSNPDQPTVLARYDRPSKLEHFEDVRIIGDQVMIFGQDGLELVRFTPEGPKAIARHSRGEVGQVAALAFVEEGLLLASSRGLLLAEPDGSNAERVMRRIVLGLDALGGTLVFTDGESIFVSTLQMLREDRVLAQFRLGREFKPERVRVMDTTALVMGHGGVVRVDLSDPREPRVISKLSRRVSGPVRDAVRVGDRVFLLGARGVGLLDRSGRRMVETVDVMPRERLARSGRHLVLVGENRLQVVDALPFAREFSSPAALH